MDIKEIKEKKKELEKEIQKIITKFEMETGTNIKNIYISDSIISMGMKKIEVTLTIE